VAEPPEGVLLSVLLTLKTISNETEYLTTGFQKQNEGKIINWQLYTEARRRRGSLMMTSDRCAEPHNTLNLIEHKVFSSCDIGVRVTEQDA